MMGANWRADAPPRERGADPDGFLNAVARRFADLLFLATAAPMLLLALDLAAGPAILGQDAGRVAFVVAMALVAALMIVNGVAATGTFLGVSLPNAGVRRRPGALALQALGVAFSALWLPALVAG